MIEKPGLTQDKIRIHKAGYKQKDGKHEVFIAYSTPPVDEPNASPDNWDSDTIRRSTPPLPAFKDALNALAQDVVLLCEEQPEVTGQINMRSVSYSWAHGVMGAKLSALKELENSNNPVVLNTPHKASESYSENGGGDPKNLFDADTVSRLYALIHEARRYVLGERGVKENVQPGLFDSVDPNDESVRYVPESFLIAICEESEPELLADDECTITMIENHPYIVTGYTGNATDGFTEARVWKAVKALDFEGETFTYQDLPPGGNLRGHEVSDGKAMWVLTGEEITLKPEPEAAQEETAPDGLEIDDDPFKVE